MYVSISQFSKQTLQRVRGVEYRRGCLIQLRVRKEPRLKMKRSQHRIGLAAYCLLLTIT